MKRTMATGLILALGTIGAIWASFHENPDRRERRHRAAEFAAQLRGELPGTCHRDLQGR